ncbi:DNA cytosine methyltransferase [Moraxella sp. ZY200743]|uniref:DNA cytosine methyltransferase n=1 Tax=Moraxella sp. ZY200743 TaxID=2911970 RepID=UPI003D7D8159
MNLARSTFIDLFAGIGGFHQALSHFGATCVFASEIDRHACHTYHANYGIMPHGDITQIAEHDIPAHDILCAGFPCQAFSISGKQKGFDDVRGTLFFDIVRIIKHHTPKIVLLENVKNLAKHDNGNTLKVILAHLNDLGYRVHYQVLNASHFGVPQNRERIYIVGFHDSLQQDGFTFPIGDNSPICVLDILQNHSHIAPIQRDDVIFKNNYQAIFDKHGNKILPNKPIQIGIVGKGGQGERIYHTDGHAITLSAHGGGIGAKTGLYHIDGHIRKLTPRECARLQGFGDDFIINPKDAQAYKQFGNSVAIPVLKAILKNIKSY